MAPAKGNNEQYRLNLFTCESGMRVDMGCQSNALWIAIQCQLRQLYVYVGFDHLAEANLRNALYFFEFFDDGCHTLWKWTRFYITGNVAYLKGNKKEVIQRFYGVVKCDAKMCHPSFGVGFPTDVFLIAEFEKFHFF